MLPFLWAQDGFSEPSTEMAEAIRFGLEAPRKLSMLGTVIMMIMMVIIMLMIWRASWPIGDDEDHGNDDERESWHMLR